MADEDARETSGRRPSESGTDTRAPSNENAANETEEERLKRNWAEILQELRVAQTGGQIFLGFLLILAFQQGFDTLDAVDRGIYLVLVSAAIASLIVALAPVSAHRALFRQHAKPGLVRFGNVAIRLTIALLAVVLVGTVVLVFDVVVDRGAAMVAGAITLALVIVAWALTPRMLRRLGSAE